MYPAAFESIDSNFSHCFVLPDIPAMSSTLRFEQTSSYIFIRSLPDTEAYTESDIFTRKRSRSARIVT